MLAVRRALGIGIVCVLALSSWACRKPKGTGPRPLPGVSTGGAPRIEPGAFVKQTHAATREALDAAYRLRPDARVLGALQSVSAAVGAPLSRPPVAEWKGGWQLAAGPNAIGSLSELPTFEEAHALIVGWATRALKEHPIAKEVAAPGPELLFDSFAVQALRDAASGPRGAGVHRTSVALVSLSVQLVDTTQSADALYAAAWGAVALDEALGQALPVHTAMLAHALGYTSAAKKLAATLPDSSAARAYVLADDAHLSALASGLKSDSAARYLWLRRLLARRQYAEALSYETTWLGGIRATLPMVLAKLQHGDFTLGRAVASDGPALVLLSAYRDASREKADKAGIATRSLPSKGLEPVILDRLGVDPKRRIDAFDDAVAEIAKSSDVLAAYYRGAMLTALRARGSDYRSTLASQPASRAFSRLLSDDKGPTATAFKRWYDALVTADANLDVTAQLLENMQAVGLGGLALTDVLDTLHERLKWDDPATYTAARRIVQRLDTRPFNRRLAGDVAYDLPDLRIVERMYRSAIEAADGAFPHVQVWLAWFAADRDLAERTLALAELGPAQRVELAGTREDLGVIAADAAHREMEAVVLGETGQYGALEAMVTHVRAEGRHDDIVRITRAWLKKNPDTRGLDGVMARVKLCEALRALGKNAEALAAIIPAAGSGQQTAVGHAAVLLAIAGKGVQARILVAAEAQRYPGDWSTAARAEIEWRLGDPTAAANVIRDAKTALTPGAYTDKIAPAFASVFAKDKVPGAVEAFDALRKSVPVVDLWFQIGNSVARTDPKLAFSLVDRIDSPAAAKARVAIDGLAWARAVKGAEADGWAKERLKAYSVMSEGAGAISSHVQDPLWLLSEPSGGDGRDLVWLWRAVAAQWDPPSAHREALVQHFSAPGRGRYHVLGRVVMGLEQEAAATALVGNPSQACEVGFYLGARAQGARRLDEANDWYRASIETSLPKENEYHFAILQLTMWKRRHMSLARIAKEKDHGWGP